MRLEILACLTWLFLGLCDFGAVLVRADHFLNEWTAEIPGGLDIAKRVAEQHGYHLVEELRSLPNHYVLHRSDTPHRSRRSAHHHTRKLEGDDRVLFAEQQHAKVRTKREFLEDDYLRRETDILEIFPDDPSFDKQWYLNPHLGSAAAAQTHGYGNRRSGQPTDLRVIDTWRKGITGRNITVCILDDGLERTHPDLAANYDPESSYDLNDKDADPTPRYEYTNENKHGTRCGGEIAMVANNGMCGVGVAYNSKIGGIRMLDGVVTDRLEAEALGFNVGHVNIFSASWGPTDDGTRMEKPGMLASKGMLKGIQEGRDGKGVLYVWASGNGGQSGDNCNADGYSSSIYTIAISSGSQEGHSPWYSEKCSSTLSTAYSSGVSREGKVGYDGRMEFDPRPHHIVSTDLRGTCTDQHTGTSAAAPMAAGLLALLLEANPDLTWRDVQHIIVHTSRKGPLEDEDGWYRNAAGYCVNPSFGFGLMDALGMVELGWKGEWTNVGPQHICEVSPDNMKQFPVTLSSGNYVEVEFTTNGCKGQENEVNYLEHVVLNLDLEYPQRGRIFAELESPGGTNTTLMAERKYDKKEDGFKDWPLMSVHTWGERPQGTWKFRVLDKTGENLTGKLKKATLILRGTEEQPEHQKQTPANCRLAGDEDYIAQAFRENDVDDILSTLNKLLQSNSGQYVQDRLKNLLKQAMKSKVKNKEMLKQEVKRLLQQYNFENF